MCPLKLNDWEALADYNLQFNRLLLVPLGLWKPKKDFDNVLFKFCICVTMFMLMIHLVPHTLYILIVVKDRAQQLILFGPLSFAIMAVGKFILILRHINGIVTCLSFIEEDWKTYMNKPEENQLMMASGQWVNNYTKFFVIFMFTGTMAHNVFAPLLNIVMVLLSTPNATVRLHAPFYFGSKVYEDSTDGFMFIVMFLTHATSFVYENLVTLGLGALMAKFVMHACCQIEIIMNDLELLVNKANSEEWDNKRYQANLKLVVVKHLRILRFIGDTEDIFSGIFFVEFIMSTIGICVLGYYVLGAIAIKNIIQIITFSSILVAYVITMYVYCYLGNRLTEKCQQVGVTAYDINWTDLIARQFRSPGMQMIIMISQHPPVLTAGKIFFLSIESFTSVMKASAAYLNMLRAVTEGL